MMRKPLLIVAMNTFLSLFRINLLHFFINSDVKKSKEFMNAGMLLHSIELWNKRIKDKPTNTEKPVSNWELVASIFMEVQHIKLLQLLGTC